MTLPLEFAYNKECDTEEDGNSHDQDCQLQERTRRLHLFLRDAAFRDLLMTETMEGGCINRQTLGTSGLCMRQLRIRAETLHSQPCRKPPRSLRLGRSRCGKAVYWDAV